VLQEHAPEEAGSAGGEGNRLLSLSSPPPHSCSEPPPLVSSIPLRQPLSLLQGAAPKRPRRLDAGPVAAGSVLSGGGWEHAERRRWLEVDKV
jgi:hypothetical protein